MTNSAGPEFVLSGYRSSTSMNLQGTRGFYWSSTAYSSATNAYNLNLINSGTVYPAYGSSNKYYGFSLRCLAEQPQLDLPPPRLRFFSRKGKEEGAVFSTPTTLTIPP